MTDETLRRLERAAKAGDSAAHVQRRRMLIRLGRASEAGLEVGDVTEYKGHRLKIMARCSTESGRPSRRIVIQCVSEHANGFPRAMPSSLRWCGSKDIANLDSKRVGILVEPADPLGEALPVGQAATPPSWRDMTALECRAALCLGRCAFAPATGAKRFARTVSAQVRRQAFGLEGEITDRQAAYMWRLLWTYRRSVDDPEILREATATREAATLAIPRRR
jgi:hypothetical protein